MIYFGLVPAAWGGQGGYPAHVVGFVALGFLTQQAFGRYSFVRAMVLLAMVGAGIEIAQGLMGQGRHADLGDFVVDLIASAVGLTLSLILTWVRTSAPSARASEAE